MIFLALLTALVLGLFLSAAISPVVGAVAAGVMLVSGIVGSNTNGPPKIGIGVALTTALLGTCWLAYTGTFLGDDASPIPSLISRSDTDENARILDTSSPADLDSAVDQIGAVTSSGPFELRLTENEVQALVNEGVRQYPNVGVNSVTVDLAPTSDQPGLVRFTASLVRFDLPAEGTAIATVQNGRVVLQLQSMNVAGFPVPGGVSAPVQTLLDTAAEQLVQTGTTIDGVTITDDQLMISGARN